MTASAQTPALPAGAASALADCSARTGHLAVVFLIDESASLRRTDPDDRRVEGVKAALVALGQVAERTAPTAAPVAVDVALLGFGVDTTEVVPWTKLDSRRLPRLLEASERFRSRDRQIDTDYAAALLGARDQLAKLSDPSSPTECTAILWFTDGQYDIEARSTGETKSYAPGIRITGRETAANLEAAGKQLLCQSGGVVDSLRGGGTEIFAVALSSTVAPIAAVDQEFLRAVAEGGAQAAPCGALRAPGSPPVGEYLPTGDLSQLISGFFTAVNGLGGGTPLQKSKGLPVCAAQTCESGTHRFAVDPGILAFNVLSITGAPGIEIELRSAEPGTDVAHIRSAAQGDARLGAATVHWTWVGTDAVLVDVTLPNEEGPWNGPWSVTFIDRTGRSPNAVAGAQLFVFGDLEPFLDPPQFRAGEANDLRVGVRHRQGTPVAEDLFTDITLEAAVVNPVDGTQERVQLGPLDADGLYRGSWTAPAPEFPATVNVSVTARATTRSGLALTPVTRSFSVDVLPPSSYPILQPTELHLHVITGIAAQEKVITVRGSDSSGGCVWVESSNVTQSPGDAGALTVAMSPNAVNKASCLHVGAGEERDLRVRIDPASASNGRAAGTLSIALVSDTNPDLVHTAVTWDVPLQKPLNTGKAMKTWLLLMAAGLLVPFLLMWLLNLVTARFADPSKLRAAELQAMVTATGVVVRKDRQTAGLTVDATDFESVPAGRGWARRFGAAGVGFRRRIRLLAAPVGEASAPGRAVGSVPPATVGKTLSATPVPFGLAGVGVVLIDDTVLDRAFRTGQAPAAAPTLGASVPGRPGRPLPPEPTTTAKPAGVENIRATKRPDLEVTLVLFAPSGELSHYAKHFNGPEYRSTIAAVVDTLFTKRRELEGSRPIPDLAAVAVDPPPPPPTTNGSPPAPPRPPEPPPSDADKFGPLPGRSTR